MEQTKVDPRFRFGSMLIDIRLLHRVMVSRLHPISSIDPITCERGYYLYALLEHDPIDFASHSIRVMWNMQRTPSNTTLPFGGLIMYIAKRASIGASIIAEF